MSHSKKPVRAETNVVGVESDNGQSDFTAESAIHCVTQTANRPLTVQLEINGMQGPFEVDAGAAAVSLISLDTKQKFFNEFELQDTSVPTAESIQVVGTMQVHVRYGDYAGEQKLFVIKGGKTSLMGWNWLQDIRLDWKSLGVARIQSGSLCLADILRKNKG